METMTMRQGKMIKTKRKRRQALHILADTNPFTYISWSY